MKAPGDLVEIEIELTAPPEEVFPYLVDGERYARWQGVRAELDPRPGGIYRVWMDADTVARGTFLEVEAPTRVVFTWGWEGNLDVPPGSSTVTITLRPSGGGSVLSLRHTGLPDGATAALHRQGWTMFTSRLEVLVRGLDPGPMPDGSR